VEGQSWQTTSAARSGGGDDGAQLVLYFGAQGTLDDGARFDELRAAHPKAHLVGCSSGGEILGGDVHDGSVVATAVTFASTNVEVATVRLDDVGGASAVAGQTLGAKLARPGLRGVFVLSDGLRVNGSELVLGLRASVGDGVAITGGLAGDGADFKRTLVGGDARPAEGYVTAIGFYGERVRFGAGCAGGWHTFGPERRVTRASGNVLYELDHKPALALYKKYLGDEADKLPGSALLFPLRIQRDATGTTLVRTVLSVNAADQSMTFAGDVPEGSRAWFMRGTHENLVQGAETAASQAKQPGGMLSVLVSCIGRKLLMGQRVADEVEAAVDALGASQPAIGFYSYGEISPKGGSCADLHNQTMTITTITED
jgi:hypothetical protein